MDATVGEETRVSSAKRWSMLGLGVLAQAASAVFSNAPVFLLPTLHDTHGMDLPRAGLLVAAPTIGFLVSLMAWGAIVDRVGERRVLVAGMAATALASTGAALSPSFTTLGIFLLIGGMAAASANAASGRVVVGWFPPQRRGFAMGIRQMALPLGVAIAALTVPRIAESHGTGWALALPTAVTFVAALACLLIVDPPRPARAAAQDSGLLDNPYRTSGVLWRIHGVSMLLVVPQYLVWTFALLWLMTDRGWSAESAGILITVTQLLGAAGRIAAGALSDRVGSRMRPLRWVAVAAAVSMGALALTDWLDSPVSIALLVLTSVITVADNGLAFTAVAEIAGPYWSGRALGAQNTSQYLAASLVPPLFGGLVAAVSFPLTFAVAALFPLAAAPLIPRDHPEHQ